MFVDVEGGAVNIKIALAAAEPGAAASLVRALARAAPGDACGELREPEPGKIRLLGFDWLTKARVLETGEVAHPHLYAIEDEAGAPATPAEWFALVHGADAVIAVGPKVGALDEHVSHRDVPVIRVTEAELRVAIDGVVEVAMVDARAGAQEHEGEAPQAFVAVVCPWCFESMEIGVEADLAGAYVQDCEVCCRPWAVTVSRDADGDLSVDLVRAQ